MQVLLRLKCLRIIYYYLCLLPVILFPCLAIIGSIHDSKGLTVLGILVELILALTCLFGLLVIPSAPFISVRITSTPSETTRDLLCLNATLLTQNYPAGQLCWLEGASPVITSDAHGSAATKMLAVLDCGKPVTILNRSWMSILVLRKCDGILPELYDAS